MQIILFLTCYKSWGEHAVYIKNKEIKKLNTPTMPNVLYSHTLPKKNYIKNSYVNLSLSNLIYISSSLITLMLKLSPKIYKINKNASIGSLGASSIEDYPKILTTTISNKSVEHTSMTISLNSSKLVQKNQKKLNASLSKMILN